MSDDEILDALRSVQSAMRSLEGMVNSHTEQGVILTPDRAKQLQDAFDAVEKAKDRYDAALLKAGFPAPHRKG